MGREEHYKAKGIFWPLPQFPLLPSRISLWHPQHSKEDSHTEFDVSTV